MPQRSAGDRKKFREEAKDVISERLLNSELLKKSKRGLFHVLFGRGTIVLVLLLIQVVLLLGVFQRLERFVPLFLGGYVGFTACMLIYVLNTRDDPTFKLSWCILIAVAPVIGASLYVYCTHDLGQKLARQISRRGIRQSENYVMPDEQLLETLRQEEPELANLAGYLMQQGNYLPCTNTAVEYFTPGEELFEAMLQALEQAEQFVFVEYFSIDKSYVWGRMLDILTRKAREGVTVRVIYDGTCDLPAHYPRNLQQVGIECKVFSPILPILSTTYNHRDHRKLLVVDGRVGFTGGINLRDRYINREHPYGHWKDAGIRLEGDAVRGLTVLFLQNWNTVEREPQVQRFLRQPPRPAESAPGYVIPYGCNPMLDERVGEMVYLDLLNTARRYAYFMTPYLILDDTMLTALCFAAKRGVDVRILLPHVPDKKSAFLLAKSHYRQLTEAGVRIYEYTPGFLHAKVALSDDEKAVVGTVNLDYRSLYLHFECAAYLYKVPALADIHRDFVRTMELSHWVTPEEAQSQPWTTRLAGALLKVFAPLM